MNPATRIRRNPWPIVIIGFFATLIALIIALIIWSTGQRMDLVRGDYYAEEIKFQEQLDRLNRTQPLNSQVAIGYDPARDAIMLQLPAALVKPDASGNIHLYRPSDAQLDHRLPLAADAHGSQQLDAKKLRPGLWKVRVQWTSAGQEYFFDQSVIIGAHHS